MVAVTWGSVPKMRLQAFHLHCVWCWAGAPFPAHSGLFPTSWRYRVRSPVPALGAGSPVLTAVVSARSWIWGPYPVPVPLGWSPDSGWAGLGGCSRQGARGSTPFSLFSTLGNREGLCLTRNTQLYVNILPLLGVGCTHSPWAVLNVLRGIRCTDPWF